MHQMFQLEASDGAKSFIVLVLDFKGHPHSEGLQSQEWSNGQENASYTR